VNYFNDFQTTGSSINAMKNIYDLAMTFGSLPVTADPVYGWTTYNGSNGDGVLAMPGRDQYYPQNSYGVDGYFPTFRLRALRLGINLELWAEQAALRNAAQVTQDLTAILGKANAGTPQIAYGIGVFTATDPTYQYGGATFSEEPADYELLRTTFITEAGF
jgi:hypothetical protein